MKAGCLSDNIKDPMVMAKGVVSWLRTENNWLLIVDNLDDVSVADGFLPAMESGHTLITTRNPDSKRILVEGLEIPVLGSESAVELLSETNGDEMHIFKVVSPDIVRELGCHALAIEQATAFVRCTHVRIAEFLQIYYAFRQHVLSRASTSKHVYPNSLAATFLLSFEKVQQNQKYAQSASTLLRFFSFLNLDEVLIDFLRAGSLGLREEL
jgi:hypothetical protein